MRSYKVHRYYKSDDHSMSHDIFPLFSIPKIISASAAKRKQKVVSITSAISHYISHIEIAEILILLFATVTHCFLNAVVTKTVLCILIITRGTISGEAMTGINTLIAWTVIELFIAGIKSLVVLCLLVILCTFVTHQVNKLSFCLAQPKMSSTLDSKVVGGSKRLYRKKSAQSARHAIQIVDTGQ